MGVLLPPPPLPPHTHAPCTTPRTLVRPAAAALVTQAGGARRGVACLGPQQGRSGKDPPLCHGPEPMTLDVLPARRQNPRQAAGAVLPLDGPAPQRQGADGRPGSLPSAALLHRSAGSWSRDVTTCPEGAGPLVSPITHGAARVPLSPMPLTPPGPAASTCASRILQRHLNTRPGASAKTEDTPRPWLPKTPEDVEDLPGPVTPREAAQFIPAPPPGVPVTHAPSQAMGAAAPRKNNQPPGPLKTLRLRLVLLVLLLTVSRAEGELTTLCFFVL